jgi:hypothetical protein
MATYDEIFMEGYYDALYDILNENKGAKIAAGLSAAGVAGSVLYGIHKDRQRDRDMASTIGIANEVRKGNIDINKLDPKSKIEYNRKEKKLRIKNGNNETTHEYDINSDKDFRKLGRMGRTYLAREKMKNH